MAHLRIDPAAAADFEAAVASCIELFRAAPGCLSFVLERQLEDDAAYVLRVGWTTLEDHMLGFRQSPAFQTWRLRAGPFFVVPPTVVHQNAAVAGF